MKQLKKWGIVLFCLGFGSFFLVNSVLSTSINVESFLYPKALSIIFLCLTFLLAIQIYFNNKPENFSINHKGLALIFLYLMLMSVLGFLIATFIFLGITMYFMGQRSVKKIIGLDLCITLSVYLIFKFIFNVPIYGGILW